MKLLNTSLSLVFLLSAIVTGCGLLTNDDEAPAATRATLEGGAVSSEVDIESYAENGGIRIWFVTPARCFEPENQRREVLDQRDWRAAGINADGSFKKEFISGGPVATITCFEYEVSVGGRYIGDDWEIIDVDTMGVNLELTFDEPYDIEDVGTIEISNSGD